MVVNRGLKNAESKDILRQMGEGEGDKPAVVEAVGPTKFGCVEIVDFLGLSAGTLGVVVFGGIEFFNKAAKMEVPLNVSLGILFVSSLGAMGIELYRARKQQEENI
jgi:hypothetical protein